MGEVPLHTVGEVARLCGVTIRTLHHYDEIGLLSPDERSDAGSRHYAPADLDRLHRILAYRALGLSLADVEAVLDEPGREDASHLERQRELIDRQMGRLGAIKKAINNEIEAREMGIQLTAQERFEVFGGFDPTEHATETKRRWGTTDAYIESKRRTSNYTKADWQRIKAEMASIEQRFAAAVTSGAPAHHPEARALAEEHRAHIDRWFYDCSPEMHRGLTEMYVSDPRFAAHYDEVTPGLGTYIRDAAAASAETSGGE